jgi:hypothetical protein
VSTSQVTRHQSLRLCGKELRPSRSGSPRRPLDAVTLQDRPDARGGGNDAHGGELTVDAAVTPLRILLRQAEDECGRSLRDGRSAGPAVRIRPAPGDEVSVPTQQSFRSDEEASESSAGEQPCEPSQHRPIRRLQRRSLDLASVDCHLVAQHDDLDSEVRVTAPDQSDELEDTAERPVVEREGHCWMLAAPESRRQSAAHRRWMAFSALKLHRCRSPRPARRDGAPRPRHPRRRGHVRSARGDRTPDRRTASQQPPCDHRQRTPRRLRQPSRTLKPRAGPLCHQGNQRTVTQRRRPYR